MPLTKGHTVVICAEDVHLVSPWNWSAIVRTHTVYAQRTASGRSVLMHRVITNAPPGMEVDHINGDGLDNRRSNLRLATHAQNLRNQRVCRDNRSGFKGVCWDKSRCAWKAQIRLGGKNSNIGRFATPEEAHAAYVAASAELHGEFGRVA